MERVICAISLINEEDSNHSFRVRPEKVGYIELNWHIITLHTNLIACAKGLSVFLSVCLSVSLSVCLFMSKGMHTPIGSDCTIGYMILTFKIFKGHFRSNKFLSKVP